MTLIPMALALLVAAPPSERPARIVEGADAPARITRAPVLTPAEGPPIVVSAGVKGTNKQLDTVTVMAFVFKADGTLKARQAAPARRTLEPNETKYSPLVVDGGPVDPTDVIVIGINQAQHAGSDTWWRTDLQRAAEAPAPP